MTNLSTAACFSLLILLIGSGDAQPQTYSSLMGGGDYSATLTGQQNAHQHGPIAKELKMATSYYIGGERYPDEVIHQLPGPSGQTLVIFETQMSMLCNSPGNVPHFKSADATGDNLQFHAGAFDQSGKSPVRCDFNMYKSSSTVYNPDASTADKTPYFQHLNSGIGMTSDTCHPSQHSTYSIKVDKKRFNQNGNGQDCKAMTSPSTPDDFAFTIAESVGAGKDFGLLTRNSVMEKIMDSTSYTNENSIRSEGIGPHSYTTFFGQKQDISFLEYSMDSNEMVPDPLFEASVHQIPNDPRHSHEDKPYYLYGCTTSMTNSQGAVSFETMKNQQNCQQLGGDQREHFASSSGSGTDAVVQCSIQNDRAYLQRLGYTLNDQNSDPSGLMYRINNDPSNPLQFFVALVLCEVSLEPVGTNSVQQTLHHDMVTKDRSWLTLQNVCPSGPAATGCTVHGGRRCKERGFNILPGATGAEVNKAPPVNVQLTGAPSDASNKFSCHAGDPEHVKLRWVVNATNSKYDAWGWKETCAGAGPNSTKVLSSFQVCVLKFGTDIKEQCQDAALHKVRNATSAVRSVVSRATCGDFASASQEDAPRVKDDQVEITVITVRDAQPRPPSLAYPTSFLRSVPLTGTIPHRKGEQNQTFDTHKTMLESHNPWDCDSDQTLAGGVSRAPNTAKYGAGSTCATTLCGLADASSGCSKFVDASGADVSQRAADIRWDLEYQMEDGVEASFRFAARLTLGLATQNAGDITLGFEDMYLQFNARSANDASWRRVKRSFNFEYNQTNANTVGLQSAVTPMGMDPTGQSDQQRLDYTTAQKIVFVETLFRSLQVLPLRLRESIKGFQGNTTRSYDLSHAGATPEADYQAWAAQYMQFLPYENGKYLWKALGYPLDTERVYQKQTNAGEKALIIPTVCQAGAGRALALQEDATLQALAATGNLVSRFSGSSDPTYQMLVFRVNNYLMKKEPQVPTNFEMVLRAAISSSVGGANIAEFSFTLNTFFNKVATANIRFENFRLDQKNLPTDAATQQSIRHPQEDYAVLYADAKVGGNGFGDQFDTTMYSIHLNRAEVELTCSNGEGMVGQTDITYRFHSFQYNSAQSSSTDPYGGSQPMSTTAYLNTEGGSFRRLRNQAPHTQSTEAIRCRNGAQQERRARNDWGIINFLDSDTYYKSATKDQPGMGFTAAHSTPYESIISTFDYMFVLDWDDCRQKYDVENCRAYNIRRWCTTQKELNTQASTGTTQTGNEIANGFQLNPVNLVFKNLQGYMNEPRIASYDPDSSGALGTRAALQTLLSAATTPSDPTASAMYQQTIEILTDAIFPSKMCVCKLDCSAQNEYCARSNLLNPQSGPLANTANLAAEEQRDANGIVIQAGVDEYGCLSQSLIRVSDIEFDHNTYEYVHQTVARYDAETSSVDGAQLNYRSTPASSSMSFAGGSSGMPYKMDTAGSVKTYATYCPRSSFNTTATKYERLMNMTLLEQACCGLNSVVNKVDHPYLCGNVDCDPNGEGALINLDPLNPYQNIMVTSDPCQSNIVEIDLTTQVFFTADEHVEFTHAYGLDLKL